MPLFVCDECDAIENTALGHFHSRNSNTLWSDEYVGKALCSKHRPLSFRDGTPNDKPRKWHGRFVRQIATLEIIESIGRDNFIYLGKFSSS